MGNWSPVLAAPCRRPHDILSSWKTWEAETRGPFSGSHACTGARVIDSLRGMFFSRFKSNLTLYWIGARIHLFSLLCSNYFFGAVLYSRFIVLISRLDSIEISYYWNVILGIFIWGLDNYVYTNKYFAFWSFYRPSTVMAWSFWKKCPLIALGCNTVTYVLKRLFRKMRGLGGFMLVKLCCSSIPECGESSSLVDFILETSNGCKISKYFFLRTNFVLLPSPAHFLRLISWQCGFFSVVHVESCCFDHQQHCCYF